MTAEEDRLQNDTDRAWLHWGPYLSERAWGTVREDYSTDGSAWTFFPHDQARSKAYRWNEDGLGGICDEEQYLCFAITLWNGQDPILKERLFGLSGPEGNHGEDVKEMYFYLDNTPTHSYMKMLYKYPQTAFPYNWLVAENGRRTKNDPEFELLDTGVFKENRYFDVFIEYAKANPDDILIRLSVVNQGPDPATMHILPTLWFRNTWSWGRDDRKPTLSQQTKSVDLNIIKVDHFSLGNYYLYCEKDSELLFTDNETNTERLYQVKPASPYVKDAFHRYLIEGNKEAINSGMSGTKTAANYSQTIEAGETFVIRLRLVKTNATNDIIPDPFADFDTTFKQRVEESDEFYQSIQPVNLTDDTRNIQRQAMAGMLWSKQFYHYIVEEWLEGDPDQVPPPPERKEGRNHEWRNIYNKNILSMPDTWEYPWYASWDLAFHTIALALIDTDFAKWQLELITRDWYQHPNGAIPAYEWDFSSVNPPVLAWATWRVYKIDQKKNKTDRDFLERMYHNLLFSFTWWLNRKDIKGNNIFEGGFLGLDNIGVFDRNIPLPNGEYIEQSDGTSWMGMFCLSMMTISLELARENKIYENLAIKFFAHFLAIADALSNLGKRIGADDLSLWDIKDQFFYDVLYISDNNFIPLKVRSLVGLIPLLAIDTIESDLLQLLPDFNKHVEWNLAHRPDLANRVSSWNEIGLNGRRLLALVRKPELEQILKRMFDPAEFLSDFGIRSISKYHDEHPFKLEVNGTEHEIKYEPAESRSGLFGGNSNWRGPIWFPINYLLIEALQRYHHYYGDDYKIEFPTGSGEYHNLNEIANDLSRRLISIFQQNEKGHRPVYGGTTLLQEDPQWRNYILFHEYFHGDNGAGLGANHQTGWTGLVAKLIQQQA